MILSFNIVNAITKWFNQFGDFIKDNYDEPFFWLGIFLVMLVICLWAISNLGEK